LFFFSSRRRHTRWPRDWSSDVCSSDLVDQIEMRVDLLEAAGEVRVDLAHAVRRRVALQDDDPEPPAVQPAELALHLVDAGARPEIGRASCRERVEIAGADGPGKKKKRC